MYPVYSFVFLAHTKTFNTNKLYDMKLNEFMYECKMEAIAMFIRSANTN